MCVQRKLDLIDIPGGSTYNMHDLPVCPKFPLSSPLLIVHHLVVLRPLCADLRKEGRKLDYDGDRVWEYKGARKAAASRAFIMPSNQL